MRRRPKVVFDTNIFISAIIFGGNPRSCLELARAGEIELFTSRELLLELARKFREKFRWGEEEIVDVIEGISNFAKIVRPTKEINLIKEELTDNRVLECAQEAKADFIISGDKKHILPIKKFQKIQIMSVKSFLDKFFIK